MLREYKMYMDMATFLGSYIYITVSEKKRRQPQVKHIRSKSKLCRQMKLEEKNEQTNKRTKTKMRMPYFNIYKNAKDTTSLIC